MTKRVLLFIAVIVTIAILLIKVIVLSEQLATYEKHPNFIKYCESKGKTSYLIERDDINEYYLKCTK